MESRHLSLQHSGTALRVLARLSGLGAHRHGGHRPSTAEPAVAITAEIRIARLAAASECVSYRRRAALRDAHNPHSHLHPAA